MIGTLYRAVTGDVIPAHLREAGALLFSGLMAGPVGVATDLGELAAEKITGLDPEKIGNRLLADLGIGHRAATPPEPAAAPVALAQAASAQPAHSWSPAQLAAYGVTAMPDGDLEQGSLQGSDVLNALELNQLQARAAARYAARS